MPEKQTPCRCDCGYRCSRGRAGQPKCGLEIMACMDAHYARDCGHDWSGPTFSWTDEDGRGGGSTATCARCGAGQMDHDMAVGP